MNIRLTATLVIVLLAAAAPSPGQTPLGTAFTYQGRLNQAGQPYNGTANLVFRLYDAVSGGNLLGTQTLNSVPVSGGLFTVQLNGAAQFGANPFDGEKRWLDITVNGTALTPRQELTVVPYAAFAAAPWTTSGNTLAYTGNVGVGNPSPKARLHVNGTSWFQGDSTPLPATAGKGIAIGSGGDLCYLYAFDYGTFQPLNLVLNHGGANVGIGTLTPTATLDAYSNGGTTAVRGTGSSGAGVAGFSSTNSAVYGSSVSGYGVAGYSSSGLGVFGQSGGTAAAAVYGTAPYIGVQGISSGSDVNRQAVRGDNAGSTTGYAGLFYGNVWVAGTLFKNAGAFKIDHPLDPANKYLAHSFVESPDMMNIYNGNVMTDDRGYAEIALPEWFEALNRDFRYQLTVLDEGDGDSFVQAKVVRKIKHNRFTVRTSQPGVEVSWTVTGIRQDPYAMAHPIIVEEDKGPDRGKYIQPDLYAQPAALVVDAVASPLAIADAPPAPADAAVGQSQAPPEAGPR